MIYGEKSKLLSHELSFNLIQFREERESFPRSLLFLKRNFARSSTALTHSKYGTKKKKLPLKWQMQVTP
jgi:hypothetical protein